MNSLQPVIAITGPDSGGEPAWFFTSKIVKALGGHPLRLRPKDYELKDVNFDGLIITGGADVSPKLYAKIAPPHQKRSRWAKFSDFLYPQNIWKKFFGSSAIDEDRDKMETTVLKKALAEKKPVLGICRGHQLINVVLGGRLEANISPHYKRGPQPRSLLPVKKINIDEDTLLHKITGQKRIYANSLHNQAVGELAPPLQAVAFETEGILQGLEGANAEIPLLGVQWHPEYLFYMSTHRKIFKWLIEAASRVEKKNGKIP